MGAAHRHSTQPDMVVSKLDYFYSAVLQVLKKKKKTLTTTLSDYLSILSTDEEIQVKLFVQGHMARKWRVGIWTQIYISIRSKGMFADGQSEVLLPIQIGRSRGIEIFVVPHFGVILVVQAKLFSPNKESQTTMA